MRCLVLKIFIFAFVFLPIFSLAQTIDTPYALSNELSVEMTPKYPKPNENVSIVLRMYTENLDSAEISWFINDSLVLKGIGETRYSFVTGNIGDQEKIEVRIKLLNGTSFSKSFTLNLASVDLIWESYSYVPPFYKGKALHPRQGALKIVAIPNFVANGKQILPQNLVYTWSNGIKTLESSSGYGKAVLVISGSDLGRAEDISVLVVDRENNIVASEDLYIKPTDPEIVFYEKNPYYGDNFERALTNNYEMKSSELQIFASPFYFSSPQENLTFTWSLNGKTISSLKDSMTALFKKPEGESGRSNLRLNIGQTAKIFQQASKNLTIRFEE